MVSKRLSYKVQCLSRTFLSDHAASFFPRPWVKMIKPVKDTRLLLLLGDIGVRQSLHTHNFIHYCSQNWERVIWIEGNLERERNQDGMPPRDLPENVQFINKSILINIDESKYMPILLYASPFRSIMDFQYLKRESKKKSYDNYLIVASYHTAPYSLDLYPGNCIGWFQSYPQLINSNMYNMYFDIDKTFSKEFHPSKYFIV